MENKPRNINPFTDFGFKKLFGEEASKDLLLDFLNAILSGEIGIISSIEYSKNELLGLGELDRRAVFDINCVTESGERIIIEFQRAFQFYFKERTLYYSSLAIQEQAPRGDWDFNFNAVYSIALLDFKLENTKDKKEKYLHRIKLIDIETREVFNKKLSFVYIEIPKFDKKPEELETKFDKWMYILKHLEFLERLPDFLQEKIFKKVMDTATISKLDKKERAAYEESLKQYRDLKNVLDSSFVKGKLEGKIEDARNLYKLGVSIEVISKATGLSLAELKQILEE